jgi:hypothetical protein
VKVLVSGSTGLIGSALTKHLLAGHHSITRLSRPGGPVGEGSVIWSPEQGRLEPESVEGYDVVIHLAGENIASGRWSDSKKKALYDSRINSTRLLCSRLKSLHNKPKLLIVASAIGFYGDGGDETQTEESSPGQSFLANLVRDWEAASDTLDETEVRVVKLRFGIVLSQKGGALAKMLPLFRKGLGGRLGNGKQYMSWITIDDVARIILHCIANETITGAVNVTAPTPVTNREFTEVLASVLNRPAFFHTPAFMLRALFGEMANELLLSSTRVIPAKLIDSGYTFKHETVREGLSDLLSDKS